MKTYHDCKKSNDSILIRLLILWAIVFWGFQTVGATAAQANAKTDELRQKIADITLLNQQLNDRYKQLVTIRDSLTHQQSSLADEITILSKTLGLNSYQKAKENLRIRYNLELLRTISAYLAAFETKSLFYQSGQDRLKYLRQTVEDDIKLISTLNDLKTEALTTQISLVINRYLPEAHIIQIDPEQIQTPSSIEVWNSIFSKN